MAHSCVILFSIPFPDSLWPGIKQDEPAPRGLTPRLKEEAPQIFCWSVALVHSSAITNPPLYPPFVLLFLIHLLACCPYLLFSLSHSNPFALWASGLSRAHSISLLLFCSSSSVVVFWPSVLHFLISVSLSYKALTLSFLPYSLFHCIFITPPPLLLPYNQPPLLQLSTASPFVYSSCDLSSPRLRLLLALLDPWLLYAHIRCILQHCSFSSLPLLHL